MLVILYEFSFTIIKVLTQNILFQWANFPGPCHW